MSRIGDFRRKVADGEYEFTGHAKDEMEQDGFVIDDVKAAVGSGRIIGKQRHGRGAVTWVVQGRAADGRRMRLIVRLTHPGGLVAASRLRVITVFEAET